MNLDELSKTIEIEVHVLHDLKHETYSRLKDVIDMDPSIHDTIQVNDFDEDLVTKLNGYSYKLLYYLVMRLNDVSDDNVRHIVSVVLLKGFKYFPNNVDLYLAYCIKQIDEDKDKFVKSCLKDVIHKIDNERKIYLNILLAMIVLIVIIGGLCFISMLGSNKYKENMTVDKGKTKSSSTSSSNSTSRSTSTPVKKSHQVSINSLKARQLYRKRKQK